MPTLHQCDEEARALRPECALPEFLEKLSHVLGNRSHLPEEKFNEAVIYLGATFPEFLEELEDWLNKPSEDYDQDYK